jgi:hypothetical protein
MQIIFRLNYDAGAGFVPALSVIPKKSADTLSVIVVPVVDDAAFMAA